jgi:hypothetical protein
MKLIHRRSITTMKMSPLNSAPRPSGSSLQCSTVPPAKWVPALISVMPGAIGWVSPVQYSISGSGRPTHSRSAAWTYTGASKTRPHSVITP